MGKPWFALAYFYLNDACMLWQLRQVKSDSSVFAPPCMPAGKGEPYHLFTLHDYHQKSDAITAI